MFDRYILVEDSLRNTDGGFAVDIRMPYYRGLGLSMVEDVTLTVDGHLSSEYEGNRHIQDALPVDSREQVRRQHAMFARLLGEDE